jgi:hypothetical protein
MAVSHFALWGRIGAHVQHSRHSPKETTKAARAAFESRWERLADPDGVLDPAERARRARHIRLGYFAELALKSALARRQRARRRNGGG